MVMRCPALLPAGRQVSHQVQTLDLFRTILDIAGIEAPFSASKNLRLEDEQRSFVVGENGIPRVPHPRDLARFGLQSEQLARFARGLTALRTDTHKLIVGTDGTVELYAWRDDPGEENNLASRHPEVVDALQKMLARWQEEHQVVRGEEREERWEVDNRAVEARLRALGYIE